MFAKMTEQRLQLQINFELIVKFMLYQAFIPSLFQIVNFTWNPKTFS